MLLVSKRFAYLLSLYCAISLTCRASDEQLLIKESSVIVIGVIERKMAVVRHEKLGSTTRQLPDGRTIAELPKPSEYMVGALYQFRINEILKGKKTQSGHIINILIPGLPNSTDLPALRLRQNYLVFLSPIKYRTDEYKGTIIVPDTLHISGQRTRFDPQNAYSPVMGFIGVLPVTAENQIVIRNIRAGVKKP